MKLQILKPQTLKLTLLSAVLAASSACVSANSQSQQGSNRGQPPSVDEAFAMMDSNKDNQLSQSEVKGPLQRDFSKIDTNSDGYISKDELSNAPKPQGRPQR